MLKPTPAIKRTATRVVLALISVSLGAELAIFGQNAQRDVEQISSVKLTPIRQNGKWGYADQTGTIVISPRFSRADQFSEGLALVWTGGAPLTDSAATSFVKMGYINPAGHWVIQSRFEYYFFDDFSEGLVPFRKQFGKWGYMDKAGKIVVRPQFDWAGTFSGGIAPALLRGKCTHLDKTGRVVDQSQTILPLLKNEQDKKGVYRFKPHALPCS